MASSRRRLCASSAIQRASVGQTRNSDSCATSTVTPPCWVTVRRQQARLVDQTSQVGLGARRQRGEQGPAAAEPALGGGAHQSGDERLVQRAAILLAQPLDRDRGIGLAADGALEAAEGSVLGQREAPVLGKLTVQVLQRVGEQRQGVGRDRVGTDRIDEIIVDAQPLVGGGTAHDLADPRHRHRSQRQHLERQLAMIGGGLDRRMLLPGAEAIGADGGDHQDLVADPGERRPEQVEQLRRVVRALGRKQLLGLVERQHERRLGPVEREPQLPGECQQLARPVRPGQARGDRLEAGRAPVGREGPGQRLGERAQGVSAAAKRPGGDPARRLLAQPRQHARPHQRRLAAARRAGDQQQLGRACRLETHPPQRLDDLPALLGAAEEDRRVVDVERGETRVDRAIGLPVEGVARVEPMLAQAAGELLQARIRDRA